MKRNRSRKLKVASFASAMADMAFLLLVFFMASTSTEPPRGVEVDLPKAETQGAEQDSIYVSITAYGDIYFEGNPVSIEQLSDGLAMRGGEMDQPVAVTADKTLDYSIVANVLDVFSQNEFLNVIFMSEPRKTDVK